MNVLSLFDGMSGAQIALERANTPVTNYYSSEIDKYAMTVAQANYPQTRQVGDISKLKADTLPKIDLLIGGSPCQGFSFSGKGLNFSDPRSRLFFEYLRLKRECNPTYFLLENVKMKKEYQNVIDKLLGVKPIEINSTLVSGQNRVRLYWTNIPNVTQPKDKEIFWNDVREHGVSEQHFGDMGNSLEHSAAIRGRYLGENKTSIVGRRLNNRGVRDDYNKKVPITQCLEVRASNLGKTNCLTTVLKDNVVTPLPIGRHPDVYGRKLPYRYLTPTEYERLQTVPDGYTNHVSNSQRYKMLGNGFTVDVIAHMLQGLKAIITPCHFRKDIPA